jgi:signal transduction histidine kinase
VIQSALILVSKMIWKSTDYFALDCGSNLPAIRGDYHKLEQVVVNLLQNACQALSSKEQSVKLSAHYDEAHERIALEIRDEGVGIPEEILHRVTGPFFTTKRNSGGTGLGLWITRMIVAEHGGELQISSRPGKGTTVTVSLPAIKGQ